MRFDHIVVHIDNDQKILSDLEEKIAPLGFPFKPEAGKRTSGFKAANIWIGRQYFEIIRLLKPNGGGWTPHWVDRYNKGVRGPYCIFLHCNDIDAVYKHLQESGVAAGPPERITFKAFFGLFKKTLPWQMIYTPEIPGTNIEIGFIQYDPDPNDWIKQFLVPNSDEKGIMGIKSAAINLPLTDDAKNFLMKMFPNLKASETGLRLGLDENGELSFLNSSKFAVQLFCSTSDGKKRGDHFKFMNIKVEV